MTRIAWAREHRINGRSLRAWQLNLSRAASKGALATRARTKLVELVPVTMSSAARRYVVRVGDGSVEVGDDFDAATLRRLLEVVRTC